MHSDTLLSNDITDRTSADQDDNSNSFIHIVAADEHSNELTLEILESCSKGFRTPVLFKGMVTVDEVGSREFLEVNVDEKLIWRERSGESAVSFRNKRGKTDYNFVSGKEGTAQQFLDEIFVHKNDVYANLGHISSGFAELHKYPWGETVFEHIRDAVFESGWFQVPEWELSGHVFLGNNTQMYADPSSGAPGSDWHMFPTTNIFVMLAGKKKWLVRPPQNGDQFRNHEELICPSGGREAPLDDREFDTVYVEPGDVLFNLPYEWHKVLNAKGWSLGAGFRVIDRPYVERLLSIPAIAANLKVRELDDDHAHLATSLHMASRDPLRMQMCLNTAEMMICAAMRFSFMK